MKIVVNSGNIGTPAAIELARGGAEVLLAVRSPRPSPELEQLGIRQVPFDIGSVESMRKALEGSDAFFSVSPLVEDLVEAGVRTFRAAKEAGVRRIVRSSAQGAGPGAAIELGRWHYAAERALEESGIPFTVLRPANFMQNFLGFGNPSTIKAQSAFYSAQGDGKVSVIDTRDISAVAARVLTEPGHEGRRYELTGGESLSNDEIAVLFSEALGRKISHVGISAEAAGQAMAGAGVPPWMVALISGLNSVARAGYLAQVKPDTESILGRPPIRFAQFIRDHLSAFRPQI